MQHSKRQRVWTVAEAKARLSEILRLAEAEGPQTIGIRRTVVIPAEAWDGKISPHKSLGQRLMDNMLRGIALEILSRRESERAVPFSDGEIE